MTESEYVVGPFTEMVTMDGLPPAGPIQDEELTVISNAGIRVKNGLIDEIGLFDDLQHKQMMKINGPAIAVPGYIDAHTHICWNGTRGKEYAMRLAGKSYQEIAKEGGGILNTVEAVRHSSALDLQKFTGSRLMDMARRGITTAEIKTGYGLDVENEIKMLKTINALKGSPIDVVPTCLAAHTLPKEFEEQEYLDMLLHDLLPQIKELTNRVDIFVEQRAFSQEGAIAYLKKAKEMGFSLTVHANQFSAGGVKVAVEVGAMSADHLEVITRDEAKELKKGNVVPIVLPGASLGLGLPFAPARMLLDEDLPLVIASDWNPGSAPNGDLVMQAAVLGAREKLTMAETFASITYRAAHALGLRDRGILRKGMRADFCIYPAKEYQEILYFQGALKPSVVVAQGYPMNFTQGAPL